MSEVLMEDRYAHIYELLIAKIQGNISKQDNELVEELIGNDQKWKQAWEDINTPLVKHRAVSFSDSLDEDKSWQQIVSRLTQAKPVHKSKYLYHWYQTAAIVALFITIAAGYGLWRKQSHQPAGTAMVKAVKKGITLELANGKEINLKDRLSINVDGTRLNSTSNCLTYVTQQAGTSTWNVLKVAPTLDYKIVLSDGTQVWLNSASTLKFPFSFLGNQREVYLTGEAYFKVAKNKKQPFIVHTAQNNIQVTGTQFNVNTYDKNETVTSLVEGSVTAKGTVSGSIKLKPGFQSVFRLGKQATCTEFETETVLAWMNGIHYFYNARLEDIANVIPRWFEIEVVFDHPEIASQTFSGAIEKKKSLSEFLNNLQLSAGIETEIEGGVLHFK